MSKRASHGSTRFRKTRKTNKVRAFRMSDDAYYQMRVLRVLMRAVQRRGTANDVCADAFRRLERCLRRKCKLRGIDADALIAASDVKPARSTKKFRGVPDTVRPRVERESR